MKTVSLALRNLTRNKRRNAILAVAIAFGFFTTEAITDLFTLVILWIVRRLDGILEEQQHYLKRIREEERDTRNGGML